MIDQVTDFADEVFSAGLVRLGRGFDHFGSFLDDFATNFFHAARK